MRAWGAAVLALAACDVDRDATHHVPPPVVHVYKPTAFAKLAANNDVAVEAVVLPGRLINTTGTNEPQRFFTIALAPDDPYFAALAALGAEVDKLDAELHPPKGKKPPKLDQLIEREGAIDAKLDDLRPDLARSVAVELAGFADMNVRTAWTTVVDECTGPRCLPTGLTFTPPNITIPSLSMGCCTVECLDGVATQLAAMAKVKPAELAMKLPDMHCQSLDMGFADRAVIARFNAIVPAYNREVQRRRDAALALFPTQIARVRYELANRTGVKRTLRGTVRPLSALAARTFKEGKRSNGASPLLVVEEAAAPDAFARTFYKTTRYCVTANVDATFTVGGKDAGKTPACTDVAAGAKLDVAVTAPKLAPAAFATTAVAIVNGYLEIECKLHEAASACTIDDK